MFHEVLEPESLGVVHRQLLDLFRRHEPEFGGLVGDLHLAAGDAGGETDVELAAHLAVGVGDDVFRVGVGADQAGDFNVEAGLFLDFTNGRAWQGIGEVHAAAGQRPQVVVAAALEEDAPVVVGDDGGRGHDHAVRLGCGWVVVVLGAGHGQPSSRTGVAVAHTVSSRLVRSGWDPVGSVSLPFARRLAKGDLVLGIEGDGKGLVIGVTLKEWQPDSDSAGYVRVMRGEYEAAVSECQLVEERIIGRLGRRYEILPARQVFDRDEYPFVYSRNWKVSDVHVTLGVEHLDPDDTPIRISLYVSQRGAMSDEDE